MFKYCLLGVAAGVGAAALVQLGVVVYAAHVINKVKGESK